MPNLPSAAAFSQPGSVLGMMGAPPQQATLPTSQADQLHKVTMYIFDLILFGVFDKYSLG